MSDTEEVKAVENDAKATETAAVPVIETVAKATENDAHNVYRNMLVWLKNKLEAVGLDIKTEVEKL